METKAEATLEDLHKVLEDLHKVEGKAEEVVPMSPSSINQTLTFLCCTRHFSFALRLREADRHRLRRHGWCRVRR